MDKRAIILKVVLFGVCALLAWVSVSIKYGDWHPSDVVSKNYRNDINYHCADWGPNKNNTDEDIYFIKQISFSQKKKYETINFGHRVYFCSMKWDGTNKKQLALLWESDNQLLSKQPNACYMSVCAETRQAVIAIAKADFSLLGLWTINLDGTNLKQIVRSPWDDEKQIKMNFPSWTPDGEYIVFQESWYHVPKTENYIVKVDKLGKNKTYITNKKVDGTELDWPVLSPDGSKVAYCSEQDGGLTVMDLQTKEKRALSVVCVHPDWSPDGKQIYVTEFSEFTIVDAQTGEIVRNKYFGEKGKKIVPKKVEWGKHGFLMNGYMFLSLVRTDLTGKYDLKARPCRVPTEGKKDETQFLYKWGYEEESMDM